jgi:cytochrome b involved in lipid metabolism
MFSSRFFRVTSISKACTKEQNILRASTYAGIQSFACSKPISTQTQYNSNSRRSRRVHSDRSGFPFMWAAAAAITSATTLAVVDELRSPSSCESDKNDKNRDNGNGNALVVAEGPIYSLEEVATHKTKATGVWVTYKDGVYDITKFVANHPGGTDKIMMAAGQDIGPFWNLYRQHFNSALPQELLRDMRIGSLSQEDVRRKEASRNPSDDKDPYNSDPQLSPVMHYISRKPINAEPPNFLLTDSWITPTDLWFVRNHHPVVHIADANSHPLTIEVEWAGQPAPGSTSISTTTITSSSSGSGSSGTGVTVVPLALTVGDLKSQFPAHSIVATLQCGGNRRAEMSAIEKTNGKIGRRRKRKTLLICFSACLFAVLCCCSCYIPNLV